MSQESLNTYRRWRGRWRDVSERHRSKITRLPPAMIIALASAQDVKAENTDSLSVSVSASVVAPIEITSVTSVQVGNIVAPSPGEFITTVNIPADGGEASYTGGGNPGEGVGTQSPSTVSISGQPSSVYAIACPTAVFSDDELLEFIPVCPVATRTLNNGGTDDFSIGGSLIVKQGAQEGAFNLDMSFTVAYN